MHIINRPCDSVLGSGVQLSSDLIRIERILRLIPPGSKYFCAPAMYIFNRQVKKVIKMFQNYTYLIKKEVVLQEACIKLHSIIHHQLSSQVFSDVLHYAWLAARLCYERSCFQNVGEVCFSLETLKQLHCKKSSVYNVHKVRHN